MRRIIFGLVVILGAGAAIATGATGAFFSDTETSTGNTFAAGAIDLTVDNESYYNVNKCADIVGDIPDAGFVWQGNAPYPVPGTTCTTSWELSDLGNGLLFFDFRDLKPDDEGEDTISLHVGTNDAYACMDVALQSNDDTSSTEPELDTPDAQEDINDTWDGELAQNLRMFWWADDGDNVYEVGERNVSNGVQTLQNLATTTGSLFSVPLADTLNNVWTGLPGPIAGNQVHYIGKAWCFGQVATTTIAQDSLGKTDPNTNGPQVRGTGITCDGTALNNLTQTDSATVDVAFRAIQARHNDGFTCRGTDPRLASLTVIKNLVANDGGNETVASFQLKVVGGGVTNMTSGVATQFAPGNYTVTETGVSGYQASFSGDCNSSGQISLAAGDSKTCTVTNNDIAPSITLIKVVSNNDGGQADPVEFTMRIDGNVVPQNTSVAVTANSIHTISEDPFLGYGFFSVTGANCPAAIPGGVTLNEGQAITCTITNDDGGVPPPPSGP